MLTFSSNILKTVLRSIKFESFSQVFIKSKFRLNIHSLLQKQKSSSFTKVIMSDNIYPNHTPVLVVDCKQAFSVLTEKEKSYAHFLSKACWYGGLILPLQTSCESPLLFALLYRLFQEQPVKELKQYALEHCHFSEEDFTAFLIYSSAVFGNFGNFKGFGDTKFIPNLEKEKFLKLINESKFAAKFPEEAKGLLSRCSESMYSLKDGQCQLGFPNVGTTTYLSKNVTKEDNEAVTEFFKKKGIELYNSRLFKSCSEKDKTTYEIRLASVLNNDDAEDKDLMVDEAVNSHKFVVTRGDYSKILDLVNKNLLLAMENASNDNQVHMIKNYVKSFKTGSLDAHKDGSRNWVKDTGPIIESYIGFIETYRDPAGVRGEWEGFVAMVNKEMSIKYTELVKGAEEFIALLPWPSTYEKDKFLKPDFTALDILTFATNDSPIGINIPNYDDIRQSEGFKNVTLLNVINVRDPHAPNHLGKEDQEIHKKYHIEALEVIVALHELLGHGCGKLFHKLKDGSFDFDVDQVVHLETNEKITSWYDVGETFNSVFGAFGSSYEECRADSVAVYLSTVPEILRLFGHEDSKHSDVMYAAWLEVIFKGLVALKMYEPKTESWLQAHSQAAFVILQVVLEAGENFITIERITGEDGNPDLLFKMDRSKILSHGKPCMGKFLKKLQLYKSTADVTSARRMFDAYSAVNTEGRYPFLEFREIVVARKKPRRLLVQANTFLKDDKVELRTYDASAEGMIQSYIDRYEDINVREILEEYWKKDRHHFE